MKTSRHRIVLFSAVMCMMMLLGVCLTACSSDGVEQDVAGDTFISPSPQVAIDRGNKALTVPLGEACSLDGQSNYDQNHVYDGLTLCVTGIQILDKDTVFELHPLYATEFAFESPEKQKFVYVTIQVANIGTEPRVFAVSELKLYSDMFSTAFWVGVDPALLADEHGDLSRKKSEGVRGFPEGWNTINPKESKQFVIPFVILNSKSGLESLEDFENASEDTLQLMVFNSYTNKEIRQSKFSQDCILFDLS